MDTHPEQSFHESSLMDYLFPIYFIQQHQLFIKRPCFISLDSIFVPNIIKFYKKQRWIQITEFNQLYRVPNFLHGLLEGFLNSVMIKHFPFRNAASCNIFGSTWISSSS
ncbi:hypothetical protein I3842_07G044400 [Carya illinoinensis]|uniref:Uncharacterized protein n=1 Tax=Carya illinoinensis TaxID=32201 RepID=A0A922EIJ1_CARIL|nr:hypothetical protein I3842_07G044400 [Carya illinoinensis]